MDKELLAQILPIVEKTKEGILKGVEVAQEQFPELVKEILHWRFIVNGLQFLIFGSIAIIGSIIICKVAMAAKKDEDYEWGMIYLFLFIPLILGGVALEGLLDCIQIFIAPKLFLIEYISSLLK